MTAEQIKNIAEQYFIESKPDWKDENQKADTTFGFRMGYAFALKSAATPPDVEQMAEYLSKRIAELNEADASFCSDRWNENKPQWHRQIAREQSNAVTLARQELETVLKKLKAGQSAVQGIEPLLELLALHGGEIVSTGKLTPYDIAQARACGRMYVDNNSLGYVWMPPTNPDKLFPETPEEVEQFEKWFPLEAELPDHLKNPDFLRQSAVQDATVLQLAQAYQKALDEGRIIPEGSQDATPQEKLEWETLDATDYKDATAFYFECFYRTDKQAKALQKELSTLRSSLSAAQEENKRTREKREWLQRYLNENKTPPESGEQTK